MTRKLYATFADLPALSAPTGLGISGCLCCADERCGPSLLLTQALTLVFPYPQNAQCLRKAIGW